MTTALSASHVYLNLTNSGENNFDFTYTNDKPTHELNFVGLPQNAPLAGLTFSDDSNKLSIKTCHWHTRSDYGKMADMIRGKRVRLAFVINKGTTHTAEGTVENCEKTYNSTNLTLSNATTSIPGLEGDHKVLYLQDIRQVIVVDSQHSVLDNKSVLRCALSRELPGGTQITVQGNESYLNAGIRYTAYIKSFSSVSAPNFALQMKMAVANNYKWPLTVDELWYTEQRTVAPGVATGIAVPSYAMRAAPRIEMATPPVLEQLSGDIMHRRINGPTGGSVVLNREQETLVASEMQERAVLVYGVTNIELELETERVEPVKKYTHMVVRADKLKTSDMLPFSGQLDIMLNVSTQKSQRNLIKLGTYTHNAWTAPEHFVLRTGKTQMLVAKVLTKQRIEEADVTTILVDFVYRNKFSEVVEMKQFLHPPLGYSFEEISGFGDTSTLDKEHLVDMSTDVKERKVWTLTTKLAVDAAQTEPRQLRIKLKKL